MHLESHQCCCIQKKEYPEFTTTVKQESVCFCRYDSIPHILMYLNYSVFTDLMFSHFDILFEAVLKDEQLWSIFPMMLKSSREQVRPQLVSKQLIIVQAILQYVANNELESLSKDGKRASVTVKLADVALRRLSDPTLKEVRFCTSYSCLLLHFSGFCRVQCQAHVVFLSPVGLL